MGRVSIALVLLVSWLGPAAAEPPEWRPYRILHAAAGPHALILADSDGRVMVRNRVNGELERIIERPAPPLLMAGDGDAAVLLDCDGSVQRIGRDARHDSLLYTIPLHEKALLMAAGGGRVITAFTGGAVAVAVPASQQVSSTRLYLNREVTSLACAPEGSWLIAALSDDTVVVYRVETAERVEHPATETGLDGIAAVWIDAGGSWAAAGMNGLRVFPAFGDAMDIEEPFAGRVTLALAVDLGAARVGAVIGDPSGAPGEYVLLSLPGGDVLMRRPGVCLDDAPALLPAANEVVQRRVDGAIELLDGGDNPMVRRWRTQSCAAPVAAAAVSADSGWAVSLAGSPGNLTAHCWSLPEGHYCHARRLDIDPTGLQPDKVHLGSGAGHAAIDLGTTVVLCPLPPVLPGGCIPHSPPEGLTARPGRDLWIATLLGEAPPVALHSFQQLATTLQKQDYMVLDPTFSMAAAVRVNGLRCQLLSGGSETHITTAGRADSARIGPGGSFIAAATRRDLSIFEPNSAGLYAMIPLDLPFRLLDISPDVHYVLLMVPGRLLCFDVERRRPAWMLDAQADQRFEVQGARFSPMGKLVIIDGMLRWSGVREFLVTDPKSLDRSLHISGEWLQPVARDQRLLVLRHGGGMELLKSQNGKVTSYLLPPREDTGGDTVEGIAEK
ncbi:hypothetical protein JW905_18040 [bacterium]|nr:hypothetical protein [candidate division CSSED10-310 bacterium]